MDCGTALGKIEAKADGLLLPREEEAELAGHLAGCPACAAEDAAISATGPVLRALTGVRAMEESPALDAMWTRVHAGIEESRERPRSSWIARWAWIPAAVALAVLALLFYPAGTDRSPFHPSTFDVAVEDVESEVATVALVDKGEDLPTVIWIIEDAKT